VTEIVDLYCRSCQTYHRAEVSLVGGWPDTKWIGPHGPPTREDHLDGLASAVGGIIDIALDRKPSAASEAIDLALEVNDTKPQPASPEWLPDDDEP
jgi:hypothetical protein